MLTPFERGWVGTRMNKSMSVTTGSSVFEALLAGTWTYKNLPAIVSEDQRDAYQRAADALEGEAFPAGEAFDAAKWQLWLSYPQGMLCTAIIERVEEWDNSKRGE